MVNTRELSSLAVSITICFSAAWLGSRMTTPSIPGWYAALRKPTWSPPNWLFAPVWSFLYLSMAVAAWLVWQKSAIAGTRPALLLFAIQLALNVAWSGFFFALHRPGAAFAEVVLLWISILATTCLFWPVSRAASWLMAPYLLWVSFAAALNYCVWKLNP